MIALVGYLGIVTALAAAGTLAWWGIEAARGRRDAATLRAPAAAMLIAAAVAFGALELAILTHDFSIAYVARNTATTTPFIFLIAGAWAALEGSIALWGLVLAGFVYLALRRLDTSDRLGAAAAVVMGVVGVFWFGIMATVADPFALCTEVANGVCVATRSIPVGDAVAPLDGLGPNPLLQNHILMAVHPPMLYLGYVGLTVPFAFAMGALALGIQGPRWLERTRRWTLVAWAFLTLGILLGAWWSYEVLGWGGYWAWDPVENAAFLPWLAATAFLHSSVVQRRRGMLQAWNVVLVIATFALTILGTFLTRSGVIVSVHSFTQSAVGPALVGFLVVVVAASLALFAARIHLVASSPRLESLASREGVFLFNNLLLTLFAFTVLVGTLYPLVFEAFTTRQVSVGRPFFDRITLPLAFALLLAIGIGPITPYRVAKPEVVWRRIRVPINAALVAGALTVLMGVRSVPVVVVVILAAFIVAVIVRQLVSQAAARHARGEGWGRATLGILRRDPGYWGGQISHIGVALVAVAVATTTGLAIRNEVTLAQGQAARIDGGYCVAYERAFSRSEPHRAVEGAVVRILDADCSDLVATLEPRVNRYANVAQPIATPSVHTGLVDDVYVSIAGGGVDALTFDIFVFPFMWLLWFGGLVTVAGGGWSLLAVRDRRAGDAAPGTTREVAGV